MERIHLNSINYARLKESAESINQTISPRIITSKKLQCKTIEITSHLDVEIYKAFHFKFTMRLYKTDYYDIINSILRKVRKIQNYEKQKYKSK